METPKNSEINFPFPAEPWTEQQLEIFAEVIANPQALINALPEEERRKYEEAQQSVVDARRAGERLAHTLFIT